MLPTCCPGEGRRGSVGISMPETQVIRISERLTGGDIYRFQVSELLRRFKYVLLIFGLLLLGAALLWLKFDGQTGRRVGSPALLLQNLLPLTGMLVLAILLVPLLSTISLLKSPNFSGPIHFTISPEGLEISGLHSRGELKWSGVVKVRETEAAFLLFPQSGLAHLLLKRAFATQDDITSCRRLLRENVAKTKLRR